MDGLNGRKTELVTQQTLVAETAILPNGLKDFVAQRGEKWAAVIGGLLQNDKAESFATLGRLVQGLARGELREQFFRELNELHEKGAIKEDFYYDVKTKGFRSLVDVLRFMESEEVLDVEKLAVLKKLFYRIVQQGITEPDELLSYQLFDIAKQLPSSALMIIAVNHRIFANKTQSNGSYTQWVAEIAKELGHGVKGLVEMHEERLESFKLIGRRTHTDLSGVDMSQNFRLTDLGVKLGEFLIEKEQEQG